ncbi:P-loop containing nucleoside triphosphate hydrolase protein, partial [Piptocephalis cylindrospora]
RLGGLVGYTVRFDDTSSPRTLIKYLTDGMLLREILSDPLLTRYRVIILDEAHERTIRTDVLFGMLKRIQKTRQEQVDKFTVLDVSPPIYPLKIVVMSATMNAGQFSRYFNQAPILIVEGRQHEVLTLCTSEAQSDYLEAARRKVLEFHRVAPRGDILVFLSGQDEIESLQKILAENIKEFPEGEWPLHVLPLFAALPPAQQAKVFVPSPPNSRKVILATNIAETSITISGVRYVVDTGVAKFRSFNPKIGIETLQIEAISQSAADQRSGRAGREDKGVCVRLYTRETYAALPLDAKPEILRCNLAPVVLQLKAVGVDDILGFDFLDPPEHASLCRALEQLYALEALDGKGHLTAEGKRMAEFPLDPTWAKVLFAAESLHCTKEVIDLISLQTADNIFFSPPQQRTEAQEARKKFLDHHGDHFTHMNVLKEYQEASGDAHWCRRNFINQRAIINVLEVRKQLRMITRRVGVDPDVSVGSGGDKEVVLQCLLRGFFQNVALLQPDGRTYKGLVTNVAVFVHPMSALSMRKAEAIVFDEIVQTTRPYARGVSAIRAGWLVDAAPRYYGNARVPGR